MTLQTMITNTALAMATLAPSVAMEAEAQSFIGRQQPTLPSGLLTPEALWAMGRVGSVNVNTAGTQAVYNVSYYSVKENKSHAVLYTLDLKTKASKQLTTSTKSETGGVWIKDAQGRDRIAFLTSESGSNQLWTMAPDGSDRQQASFEKTDVVDFLFSPNSRRVILVKEVEQRTAIQANDDDLPLSSGMVINDLM
ncbi:MAG: peptidase S9, partial [Bacteroidaceae bacterium]|nr:peptidase S9 [Bacteroidaceae bacterium]